MRAVIQNVKDCYLRIDNEVFSSIDSGFLILISFTQGDDLNLAKKFIDKIITLRVFPDENGKTNLSLKEISQKWNKSYATVKNINSGRSHKKEKYKYPLRDNK